MQRFSGKVHEILGDERFAKLEASRDEFNRTIRAALKAPGEVTEGW